MTKVSTILTDKETSEKSLWFHCPGCKFEHRIVVEGDPKKTPVWKWNGKIDSPTIKPSIKVQWPTPNGKQVCHSFVKNGKIMFLNDCTHSLKGKTVNLPEYK